jgi:ribosome assembly protein YihI (activator of Der GTPase)
MPSTSKSQEKLMLIASKDPKFAAKVGVPVKVAKEFAKEDKKGKRP